MNDVFKTGCISASLLGGIMEKYGVKLGDSDLTTLNRYLANENGDVSIQKFIGWLEFPSHPTFTPALKSVLYKIRWKKRVSFKDIKAVFENISTCFVASYSSQIMKKKLLTPSTFIKPALHDNQFFYKDYFYKDFNKVDEKSPNLIS